MPSAALALFSSLPATLAFASALLLDVVPAANVTAPPAVILRSVVAMTLSEPIVSASEMPRPVSPDLVSPLATVSTEPLCAALASSAPVSLSSPLVAAAIFALLSLFDTVIAITGVAAVPPLAPPSACVVIAFDELAESLMSCASLICASPISALVSVSPMLSTSDAPMPNLLASPCVALVVAALATKFSALSATSPLSVTVSVAVSAMLARALLMPTLTASAPATPVLPPLAPAIAVAPKLCVASPLTSGVSASTLSPSAVTFAPEPTDASLVTCPTLTATAMPTPVPPPLPPRRL